MNRNILWGQIFVDELARSGLKAVCAAPGSRHTPLMLAFAKHPDIKVYSHLDERSASFFALGLALASDEPVALVCSSGTAGANMYPAIIEAHQSRVPLIVLTADRPHELRHSGANQTIDQIKMFGDFALWFVDMQLPEANPPAIAIRNLRTTANRAYATANGLRKGVVHLNFPFRKPLEPTPVEGDLVDVPDGATPRDNQPYTTFVSRQAVSARLRLGNAQRNDILGGKGIIYFGRHATQDINTCQLLAAQLSEQTGFPVLAEGLSGLRHQYTETVYEGDTGTKTYVYKPLGQYEFYINSDKIDPSEIRTVIRFGAPPLSKAMQVFMSKINPLYHIYADVTGEWADDTHSVTHYIEADAIDVMTHLLDASSNVQESSETVSFAAQVAQLESVAQDYLNDALNHNSYFDANVVFDVLNLAPHNSTLFIGNSLPVRHVDQYWMPSNKRLLALANRGASGIDGNISTALGAGSARANKPLVAIFGDITFYHDMNGLLAVHRCGVPITIVLINNDGGGIFNRLPIRDYEPEFTEYFITPHGLDFSHAAKLYGLDYVRIDARQGQREARTAFREVFARVVGSSQSTIIEVQTDSKFDEVRRQDIVKAMHERIKNLNL